LISLHVAYGMYTELFYNKTVDLFAAPT